METQIETIKQLRPIERLFLISKERKDIYEKKAKTFCLLYSLISEKHLKPISSKGFKLNFNNTNFPNDYESYVLDLLKEEKYLELDNFINTKLVFDKTLVRIGLLREEITVKKRFWLKLAQSDLVKQPSYFDLQGFYSKKLEEGTPILNLVCEDPNYFNQTKDMYLILKTKMFAAAKAEEEKKNSKTVEVKEIKKK